MTEPITNGGILIGLKHVIAAGGALVLSLWGTWKMLISKKLDQIDEHEDKILDLQKNYISRQDFDKAMEIDIRSHQRIEDKMGEGFMQLHKRVDDLFRNLPKRTGD